MHQSSNAAVTNSLRLYGARSGAILLMTSADQNVADALEVVFDSHRPKVVDPETELDWDAEDVGDCVIGENGVVLTIVGSGGFMGARFEAAWGRTPERWKANARMNGCAWLGLVSVQEYQRLMARGWGETIPPLALLKLEVTQ